MPSPTPLQLFFHRFANTVNRISGRPVASVMAFFLIIIWAVTGPFLTAILFVIAKFALGLYFGASDLGSTYGAAGSIILIMLWVSYAGLILLFGAEFTQVHITRMGKKIKPTSVAMVTE